MSDRLTGRGSNPDVTGLETSLIAAPHTAFHADGSLNLDPVAAQAELMLAGGVRGAFVCGTTGEGMSLTADERMRVARRWRDVAPAGFAVIIHVTAQCLDESKALAAHAASIGADAMAVTAPCFYRPRTPDELADWCAAVAAAAPELPLLYYHIPGYTGVYLPMLAFLERAGQTVPTLVGVKFTHEDMMDYGRCLTRFGGRYNLLFGLDGLLLAALALGAHGAIGGTYGYAGRLFSRIVEQFEAGSLGGARTDQATAMEMIAALADCGGHVPAGKAVLKMMGVDCGPVRAPLVPLTEERYYRLRAELDRIGFFDVCLPA